MLAHVRQPLLDDAEYLDLLVGREADVRIDLDVHFELAVGAEELDIAVQCGVERRASARRREREYREARFLLRKRGNLLEPRQNGLEIGAGSQHVQVRGEGEIHDGLA